VDRTGLIFLSTTIAAPHGGFYHTKHKFPLVKHKNRLCNAMIISIVTMTRRVCSDSMRALRKSRGRRRFPEKFSKGIKKVTIVCGMYGSI